MKPVRLLVSFFWTWFCTTFNSIPIILNLLTNRNIALIYWVTICEQKTKDCAWSGSFQHKLQHHCFRLRCLPAFITSSLTNYGDGDASRLGWPAERRKKRLGSPSVINEKKHNDGHGNFIKPPARILLGKPVRLGVKQNSACPRNCFKLHPLN